MLTHLRWYYNYLTLLWLLSAMSNKFWASHRRIAAGKNCSNPAKSCNPKKKVDFPKKRCSFSRFTCFFQPEQGFLSEKFQFKVGVFLDIFGVWRIRSSLCCAKMCLRNSDSSRMDYTLHDPRWMTSGTSENDISFPGESKTKINLRFWVLKIAN